MTDTNNANGNGNGNGNGERRRRLLIMLFSGVAALGLLYGAYWFFYARYYVDTNDAYVAGDVVAITSREQGTVKALYADNTQWVKKGQLLVELDPVKVKVDVDAATADLARTVRAVKAEFSKVDELRAEETAARTVLSQDADDYKRRQEAGASVSREELDHARDTVTAAKAKLDATQSALAEASAAVQGTHVADNPDVLAAEAKLRQSLISLAHMRLVAPVSGEVAERNVQLGEQIAPGTPLMAVVPLEAVWIEANFKEGQLASMRVGQPVTVTADIYGGGVTYHGHVVGLGAGTGSAFALLPAQNASGNWIKIVQRLPVRVALDPAELAKHPLRIGLSVDVSVDIADTSGAEVTSAHVGPHLVADTGDDGTAEADRIIKRILAENGV